MSSIQGPYSSGLTSTSREAPFTPSSTVNARIFVWPVYSPLDRFSHPSARIILSAPSGTTAAAPHLTRLLVLHDVRDLHVDVEELGGAAVEAHALALVELALAVVGRDALLLAHPVQAIFVLESHQLSGSDRSNHGVRVLRKGAPYRFCMSKTIFISFSTAAIFSADVGCGRPPNPRKDMVDEWLW